MNEIEIGNTAVIIVIALAAFAIAAGWVLVPSPMKRSVIAIGLMFIGWQIIEFVSKSVLIVMK